MSVSQPVPPTPKDTEAERLPDAVYRAFEAAFSDEDGRWRPYLWRQALESAAAVLAASPAVTEGERAGGLADCEKCGHFQDWATASHCGACGWPDAERMRWRAEFDAIPASPAVTAAEDEPEYGHWNGIEEAAWNLPHRALVDGLLLSDEQRAAVHEALDDNYQHGHEDGIAEQNTLADIGRTLLRDALGAEAAERYRDAMAADPLSLTPADQERVADLLAPPAVTAVPADPGLCGRPVAGNSQPCSLPARHRGEHAYYAAPPRRSEQLRNEGRRRALPANPTKEN